MSLTKISEALGKLAALEKGDDDSKTDSRKSVDSAKKGGPLRGKFDDKLSGDNDGVLITSDAILGKTDLTEESQTCLISS